mgnify:FL=1
MAISFFVTGCQALGTQGTLQVYDKLTQEPVLNAQASLNVRYTPKDPWGCPRYEKKTLEESSPGCFSFSYPSAHFRDASIGVWKKGYYGASIALSNVKEDASIRLELPPIQNAISLIAMNWTFNEPTFFYATPQNVKHYDCLKADWLPPYGDGLKADMEFSLQRYNKNGKTYAWFSIRFINPHDGFEEVTKYYADSMRIREAPAMKNLQNQLDFIEELHDGFPTHFPPLKNYAFRVRTQRTPSGELLSAYYGKLYNAFTFNYVKNYWACDFEYYLNPAPNNRNLEYNGHSINKPKERINAIRYVR